MEDVIANNKHDIEEHPLGSLEKYMGQALKLEEEIMNEKILIVEWA